MKLMILLSVLFTAPAFAVETITCSNKIEPNLSYLLQSTDYETYTFKVIERVLSPNSCQSRWGCDYIEKVLFKDVLEYTDVQGAGLFESELTYIAMEDMDDVQATYTVANENGIPSKISIALTCNRE